MAPLVVYGQSRVVAQYNQDEDLKAFRQYKEIYDLDIVVPTVVEVPIEDLYLERLDFAVLDQNSGALLPYYYKKDTVVNNIFYSVKTTPVNNSAHRMTDNNSNTYAEFELDDNDRGVVTIDLKGSSPITSSAIVTLLDKNIALPTSVEVSAVVNGRDKKLLAETDMDQQTIRIPQTTASEWRIIFTYTQPLRISEIRLVQENLDTKTSQSLRFLAQPYTSYKVYFDPDRAVFAKTSEAGDLTSDEGIKYLGNFSSLTNPMYMQSDIDKDGLPDIHDNCVSVSNTDQEDVDKNGRGDACDDYDRDGIINSKDNCPNDPNRNQRDTDGDKVGDVCDGAESRLTEQYKWIPWLGIVFALGVIIVLFIITARSKEKQHPNHEEQVRDEDLE